MTAAGRGGPEQLGAAAQAGWAGYHYLEGCLRTTVFDAKPKNVEFI